MNSEYLIKIKIKKNRGMTNCLFTDVPTSEINIECFSPEDDAKFRRPMDKAHALTSEKSERFLTSKLL